MKKTCKWCLNEMEFKSDKQYGAHLTNCKSNPDKIKRDKLLLKKSFKMLTCKCGNLYEISITDKMFVSGKYKKFCSRKCANSRIMSDVTISKISNSIKKNKPLKTYELSCQNCQIEFNTRRRNQKFCTRNCSIKFRNKNFNLSSNAGKISAQSQQKRSKNEILFAKFCIEKFKNVLLNEPIFNSWDADIILNDEKVAILWNGIWHYKKINGSHSVDQVQNRDRIKMKEIEKCGYRVYVIKDMGKFDTNKVIYEWHMFNLWLNYI